MFPLIHYHCHYSSLPMLDGSRVAAICIAVNTAKAINVYITICGVYILCKHVCLWVYIRACTYVQLLMSTSFNHQISPQGHTMRKERSALCLCVWSDSNPSRITTGICSMSHHQGPLKVSSSIFRTAGSCRPTHMQWDTTRKELSHRTPTVCLLCHWLIALIRGPVKAFLQLTIGNVDSRFTVFPERKCEKQAYKHVHTTLMEFSLLHNYTNTEIYKE